MSAKEWTEEEKEAWRNVQRKYQKQFIEFASQGDAQALFAKVNWEKLLRAQSAEEAEAIAMRVVDPNRSFEVPGFGVVSPQN